MKPLLKLILVVAGILLAVSGLTLTQAAGNHALPVSPAAGVPPSTETLFKQKCSKSHGADGSGDTSMGRIFNAPDFSDGGWAAKHSNPNELVSAIARGKKTCRPLERS
jgi:hypothetical protein